MAPAAAPETGLAVASAGAAPSGQAEKLKDVISSAGLDIRHVRWSKPPGDDVPVDFALWFWLNLKNALIINVVLAMFNLVPLPPLDGGRIAVGVLPKALAIPLAHLERYGMLILIALLLVVPLLGDRLGVDLNVVWRAVATAANAVIELILQLTGSS